MAGFEEREKKVVREFLSTLAMPVTVVKGNHDSMLENSPQLALAPAEGLILRDGRTRYGLFHGHAWPAPALFKTSALLLGNLHPVFEFRDGMGGVYREKVWLSGKIALGARNRQIAELKGVRKGQKFVVFPAYSNLVGGAAVNNWEEPRQIGPLFRHGLIDLEKTGVTLLNGVKVK
ncbi:hypothetical protein HY095_03615 [Candidatus Micrarchaeota archaeon]|nr:hypothetical protein [Candidatus Micrarchaeota archaeon]